MDRKFPVGLASALGSRVLARFRATVGAAARFQNSPLLASRLRVPRVRVEADADEALELGLGEDAELERALSREQPLLRHLSGPQRSAHSSSTSAATGASTAPRSASKP